MSLLLVGASLCVNNISFCLGRYTDHIDSYRLLLERAVSALAPAHAGNRTALPCHQRRLQVIVLNGCSTLAQVQGLGDMRHLYGANAPATVATDHRLRILCQRANAVKATQRNLSDAATTPEESTP